MNASDAMLKLCLHEEEVAKLQLEGERLAHAKGNLAKEKLAMAMTIPSITEITKSPAITTLPNPEKDASAKYVNPDQAAATAADIVDFQGKGKGSSTTRSKKQNSSVRDAIVESYPGTRCFWRWPTAGSILGLGDDLLLHGLDVFSGHRG